MIRIEMPLVMIEFITDDPKFGRRLMQAINSGACPDWARTYGESSGAPGTWTAFWRPGDAPMVSAWAESIGITLYDVMGRR